MMEPEDMNGLVYKKNLKRFKELEALARTYNAMYGVNEVMRDDIFSAMDFYAKKSGVSFEIVRCPLQGEGVRALSFVKDEVIFLFINTLQPLNEQVYAAAQGLYQLHEYARDMEAPLGWKATWLEKKAAGGSDGLEEETQSSAFAGLMLMPAQAVRRLLEVYDISEKRITKEDVLLFMDAFAVPYRECVKRLYECGIVSSRQAMDLHAVEDKDIQRLSMLTGKARRWEMNGRGLEKLGSLLENYWFNVEHDLLSEKMAEEEKENIQGMIDTYGLNIAIG